MGEKELKAALKAVLRNDGVKLWEPPYTCAPPRAALRPRPLIAASPPRRLRLCSFSTDTVGRHRAVLPATRRRGRGR